MSIAEKVIYSVTAATALTFVLFEVVLMFKKYYKKSDGKTDYTS